MPDNSSEPNPPKAEPSSLTDEIFERFGEALLQSEQFDPETIERLKAIAAGRLQPTGAAIAKLLAPDEPSK
jgi:hypothetical protein